MAENTLDYKFLNDSAVRPRIKLKDVKGVLNNTISRNIWDQLPPPRTLTDDTDKGSCPILHTNDTLATLAPGWEGIPTNILVNIILSAVNHPSNDCRFLSKI